MISLRSRVTQGLLSHFFLHEGEAFYINQLAKNLGLDRGNLIKKLKELADAGLLQSEFRGNQRYYSLNRKYPLYGEYRAIFQKTLGMEAKLSKILHRISGVKKAWLFGSYVFSRMDAASDIDLLVVGDQNTLLLYKELANIQKTMGREINSINMSPKEFQERQKRKDPFLKQVFKGKTVQLL